MKLPASVRCWPRLWSLPLLIQRPSDQGATSRPGSVSCRSSTRVEARTGSAISANKVRRACAILAKGDFVGDELCDDATSLPFSRASLWLAFYPRTLNRTAAGDELASLWDWWKAIRRRENT